MEIVLQDKKHDEISVARLGSGQYFGEVELLGYQLKSDRVKSGEVVDVTTYWRKIQATEDQAALQAVLALTSLNSGEVLGHVEAELGSGVYPSWAWNTDEIVATETHLVTHANSSALGEVRLG